MKNFDENELIDKAMAGRLNADEQFDETVETSVDCYLQRCDLKIGRNTERVPGSDPFFDLEQIAEFA